MHLVVAMGSQKIINIYSLSNYLHIRFCDDLIDKYISEDSAFQPPVVFPMDSKHSP